MEEGVSAARAAGTGQQQQQQQGQHQGQQQHGQQHGQKHGQQHGGISMMGSSSSNRGSRSSYSIHAAKITMSSRTPIIAAEEADRL